MRNTLMEVRYQDAAQKILLTGYADTFAYDQDSMELIALRFGGYPEMVSGLSTAIQNGGSITVRTAQEEIHCTAAVKQYEKTQTRGDAYAIVTLRRTAEQPQEKADEPDDKTNDADAKEALRQAQERRYYLFCAAGDREALYDEIDRRSIVPMIPDFRDHLLAELQRRQILAPCIVHTTGQQIEVWRLICTPKDANIAQVLTDGLRDRSIVIPGALPQQETPWQEMGGVTAYLGAFGSTLAERIRRQFYPLYDPAEEPLSEEIRALNEHIIRTVGYSLYPAQLAAAEALKRRLAKDKLALLIAECGAGKSKLGSLALHAAFHHKRRKCFHIILCPAHMLDKWIRELQETIPDVTAVVVRTPHDFDALYARYLQGTRTTIAVLSKENARDGYMRRPAVTWSERLQGFLCPDCGTVVPMEVVDCGSKVEEPATSSYFCTENRKNHKCPNCGASLWTATHSTEQSEWVRISTVGFVHRRLAHFALPGCKNETAMQQLRALVHDPAKQVIARGACRRYPLSAYIKRKYSGRIDGFLADEMHQYAGNSGQGDAMGELYAAAKKCICMTATLINGYASGIFYLLYRVRAKLMREDGQAYSNPTGFAREYGICQQSYECTVGGYSANRRTIKRKKREKQLPGVSPLVYSRFLLENAVFLSLKDMGKELPEYEEIPVPLQLPAEQFAAYRRLEDSFVKLLKDRTMRRAAQKLLSVYLNLLMAYPDQPYGHEPICDPLSGEVLLTPPDSGAPDQETVKDAQALDIVQRKTANGERVLLFVNWVRLDSRTRLLRLLAERGISAEILENAVPPQKREAWVAQHLQQGMQVLITNPANVETGLDLNAFTTLIFYDMAFKLFTFRQASRRSWRINQTAPRVEVYLLYYRNTMQERAICLMASKLAAAGVIEGALTDEGLAAMSEQEDMTTALAKELADGIRHAHAVEDIATSFRKMAVLHTAKEEKNEDARQVLPAVPKPNPIMSIYPAEQLSLWDLAG